MAETTVGAASRIQRRIRGGDGRGAGGVYTAYEAQRPVMCLDEASKQWAEVTTPLPPEPGQPLRIAYEYERRGTANMFMVFEPLAGKRQVHVTERRTAVDFAAVVRRLVDVDYAQRSGWCW